jgi:pimeloyl-ACP methyl ester carboxylesterase
LTDIDPGGLPAPIAATAADLPPAVANALVSPARGHRATLAVAGYRFASISWGSRADRPLLLVHGVTSSSGTWWRIGPALAASGRHVVAPDLPGHGRTGGWRGRQRFAETAADLAAFVRAAGLDRPDLEIVGHSWGGLVCAALPAAGVRPRRLVLLDPPALPLAYFREYVRDPLEQLYADLDRAEAAVRAANPAWIDGDVRAKAQGLSEFEVDAARSVVLENGDWDGGLSALADPAASGVPVWFVKGEALAGSMIPGAVVPALAARVGADHVLTIRGGAHSPQRLHPEATLVALLRALAD